MWGNVGGCRRSSKTNAHLEFSHIGFPACVKGEMRRGWAFSTCTFFCSQGRANSVFCSMLAPCRPILFQVPPPWLEMATFCRGNQQGCGQPAADLRHQHPLRNSPTEEMHRARPGVEGAGRGGGGSGRCTELSAVSAALPQSPRIHPPGSSYLVLWDEELFYLSLRLSNSSRKATWTL